jgi:N-acetyl-1-D-myo-inositol-2-amino-2-deoxy-alpha-D-glucopyranoside deacetylase
MKVVFVHAHPDDEVITTSLTIAKFIEDGHEVTILHFLKGDAGVSFLNDYPQGTNIFIDKRLSELDNAMETLGVTDYRILTNNKDSHPKKELRHEDCFMNQDISLFVNNLCDIFNEIKPDLVITYDELGYSSHPDHIKVNEITMLAAQQIENHGYKVPIIWWTAFPWNINPFLPNEPFDRVFMKPYRMSDIDVTIDGEKYINKKIQALKCYETQLKVFEEEYVNSQGTWIGYWIMSGSQDFKVPIFTKEYYVIPKR